MIETEKERLAKEVAEEEKRQAEIARQVAFEEENKRKEKGGSNRQHTRDRAYEPASRENSSKNMTSNIRGGGG